MLGPTYRRALLLAASVLIAVGICVLISSMIQRDGTNNRIASESDSPQGGVTTDKEESASEYDDAQNAVENRRPARKQSSSMLTDSADLIERQNILLPQIIAYSRSGSRSSEVVNSLFSIEDVPVLLAFLTDPEHRESWADLIWIIPHLSTEDTRDEIVSAYIDFVTMEGSWDYSDYDEFGAKLVALRLLGYLGGEKAENALRSALTEEGSHALREAWRDQELPGIWNDGGNILVSMRSEAALGLVYSGSPNNAILVEQLHTALRSEAQAVFAISNREWTIEERDTKRLFVRLSEALGIRDYMQEIGREEYIPIIFTRQDPWGGNVVTYLRKYGVPIPE